MTESSHTIMYRSFIPQLHRTLIALVLCAASLQGDEIYVSLQGNDTSAGEKSAPFLTLERAQKEVRSKLKAGLTEPITVYLRGGFYELAKPLEFGPEDSSTAEYPIKYAGYPGEQVVLSGGRKITRWSRLKNNGWWKAVLPEVKAGDWFFRQLTVGGERAVRSRWPNEDGKLRLTKVGAGLTELEFNIELPTDLPPDQETELVVYQDWASTRGRVKKVEKQSLTTETAMGWLGHNWLSSSPGKPAYLEHGFSLIDQPGEWFLHRKTGTLIYYPRPGEQPTKTTVVAPRLEQLLILKGAKGKPVKHLHFNNLHFAHTDFPLPKTGYSEIQAAHYGIDKNDGKTFIQPVAIECVYTENCIFERCRFVHLGASGVGFGVGCSNNKLVACSIKDIGGNGVMVGWGGIGRENESLGADWADLNDAPRGNQVLSCQITQCGMDSKGGVGIFAAFSADTRTAHNVVHDMPYTGVSIGYRWNTDPTSQVRCTVEYNHIYDVMKKLADGGGVYTLGFQPGTVLRANHIHQVHRSAYAHGGAPNNGFFLDEGSKGFTFEANVIYDVSGEPIRFNQSKREAHTWKKNFFSKSKPSDNDARRIMDRATIEKRYRGK